MKNKTVDILSTVNNKVVLETMNSFTNQTRRHKLKKNQHSDTFCGIPELNPFDPEIIGYLEKGVTGDCPIRYLTRVEGETLVLKADDIHDARYRYIRRVDDFKVNLSDWKSLVKFHRSQVKQGK